MILIMIGWEKRKIVKRKQSVTDKNIWEIIVVDKILKMILKNEIVFEKSFLQPTCQFTESIFQTRSKEERKCIVQIVVIR